MPVILTSLLVNDAYTLAAYFKKTPMKYQVILLYLFIFLFFWGGKRSDLSHVAKATVMFSRVRAKAYLVFDCI